MKTFAGKKVIHEGSRNKEDFELVVQLKDFRACAKAYKNATKGSNTFVALAEDWGVNFHVPKWYRDQSLRFETGIAMFDEAKKLSTKWLREMCKRDDQGDD
jgi:hypothetical protein